MCRTKKPWLTSEPLLKVKHLAYVLLKVRRANQKKAKKRHEDKVALQIFNARPSECSATDSVKFPDHCEAWVAVKELKRSYYNNKNPLIYYIPIIGT